MEGLRLDFVTPDKVVLQADVEYVGASGVDGQFGLLPSHAAMLSALKIGDLYYRQGGATNWVFVSGGFAQIADNKVTILAEAAELAADIDVDRAEQAKARAEKRLADPQPDTLALLANIKLNLYASEIMVFTPKGEMKTMPKGSTVLDFAFSIHSFLGSHCFGAKVNHRLVPLSYLLRSGDQVEILTSRNQRVQTDWLKFATTAKARAKIQAILRRESREKQRRGEEMLRDFLLRNNFMLDGGIID